MPLPRSRLKLITDGLVSFVNFKWPSSICEMSNIKTLRISSTFVADCIVFVPLFDKHFLPNLIRIELFAFKDFLKFNTSGLFEAYLEVRGHQLKRISLTEEAPRLVRILANAKTLRLDFCVINIVRDSEQFLNVEYFKKLYGIYVHKFMSFKASDVDYIRSVRDEALKTLPDKKCQIKCCGQMSLPIEAFPADN